MLECRVRVVWQLLAFLIEEETLKETGAHNEWAWQRSHRNKDSQRVLVLSVTSVSLGSANLKIFKRPGPACDVML